MRNTERGAPTERALDTAVSAQRHFSAPSSVALAIPLAANRHSKPARWSDLASPRASHRWSMPDSTTPIDLRCLLRATLRTLVADSLLASLATSSKSHETTCIKCLQSIRTSTRSQRAGCTDGLMQAPQKISLGGRPLEDVLGRTRRFGARAGHPTICNSGVFGH
jgi:hypothetical protein